MIPWRWVLSRDFGGVSAQERERAIRWEAERNAELRGGAQRGAEGERRCRLEDTWQMGRAGGLLTEDLEPIWRVLGQQLGNEAFNVWLEQLAHLLPFGFAPIADEFGENFGIA